jgi:hypothetical protein
MRYLFLLQRDGEDPSAAGTAERDRLFAEYASVVAAVARQLVGTFCGGCRQVDGTGVSPGS